MTHKELRKKYFEYIAQKDFSIIPSFSLVPENDPSVLFTTAGVQPLVPYLMGDYHPEGNRIADIQKCVRTQDIDEVGDKTHDTFFEMIGYWYLGKDSTGGKNLKEVGIETVYEFYFTDKGLNLDIDKAYITCFAGNNVSPRDTESAEVWKNLGIPAERIFFLEDNWWSAGESGPCGPDTEVFYNISGEELGDLDHQGFLDTDEDQKIVEIGNCVFMLFEKSDGEVVGELDQQNVDFGGGFERVLMALQETDSIFETDVFSPIYNQIEIEDVRERRIVADHIRTSVMMINDGVRPSNTDQGYILRRLIRRFTRILEKNKITEDNLSKVIEATVEIYNGDYEFIDTKEVVEVIKDESNKFRETLEKGLKEFEKVTKDGNLSGQDSFKLFSTHGFPFEVTKELAKERGIKINEEEFNSEIEKHKSLSRTATKGKFKGGLAGNSEVETRYHTATHLLNAALRQILGEHVVQKGSNINEDRMRFDFTHDQKIEKDVLDKIEKQVNDWIEEGIEVEKKEMSYDEAKKLGAIGVFDDKYGDTVSVYMIGEISREFCGGPHVLNTSEIGKFKIKKEESSSKGVRRIKAVLE